MVPRAEYLRFALSLQESADESPAKLKATLEAALANCASVDPWKAHLQEAGARHSASDMQHLQGIHDAAAVLGASCGTREAAKLAEAELKLVESVAFPVDIELREAYTAGTKIKLIAPGKGSTAWYTEAALKKAATDKIFRAGLPMRIDHPTRAEQAARPEGSVKDWGAVLGTDAEWLESYIDKSGKDQGKGLYSDVKPFSDHSQTIKEKGAFAGVSIMANGNALSEAGRVVVKDGVPVLKEFTSAEGVDMVTRAGAGGLFLQESARAGNQQEVSDMDSEELKALKEAQASLAADNRRLLERATRADARELAASVLAPLSLVEASKARVITDVLTHELPMKDGTLDAAKFTEAVNASAKAEGAYVASLLGSGQIRGMGAGAPQPVAETPEQINAREAANVRTQKNRVNIYADLMGGNVKAAEAAVGYKGAA